MNLKDLFKKSKKIKYVFLISVILKNTVLMSQDIEGDWRGKINVKGQEMELVFHFIKNNTDYLGFMDNSSEGQFNIPIEKLDFSENKLIFFLLNGLIQYSGEFNTQSFNGQLHKNGVKYNLDLNKVKMKKPGNQKLPSSIEELEKLASKENGSYKYNVEDYFSKPNSSSFQLSPSGKYMSFRKKDKNLKNHVFVKNISNGQEKRVIIEGEELIRGYGWANNERLVYIMDKGGNEDYHLFAVNIDGSNQIELTPYDGVKVNIIEPLKDDKDHMIILMNKNNPHVFDPYKINLKTGKIDQLFENNDINNPISDFLFDKGGNLRGYTKLKDGVINQVFYKIKNNKFKLIRETNWYETFSIQTFNYSSSNPDEAYVVSDLESDKTKIYRYDLRKNKFIEILYENNKYDVSNISISRNRNWELDYFSYEGEKFNIIPVSKYFKKLHKKLSIEFAGYDYYISDKTDDESHYLIYVTSDKLYGKYYYYNVEKDKIDLLFDLMPQLDENDMSRMEPIEFISRDGLVINGYITLPKSRINGDKVPLIVNPHGGPQGIRDSWGFNPEAQLFASRGYATLHINFRISGGYGKSFLQKGFKQIGRKAMEDIEDGLKYVVHKGWINSDKVAIYGGSHGGYAVLRALTKTPELYTCGIDYVGVSNLFTFLESIPPYWKPYLEIIKAIWYDKDIEKENEIINEISPVFHVDKIIKPLFVIQGANDPRVNINESDQIVGKLREKGFNVPYMVKYDEGHGFAKEENRMALYKVMMGFLAQNLKD